MIVAFIAVLYLFGGWVFSIAVFSSYCMGLL
jgi:hypothetical protein